MRLIELEPENLDDSMLWFICPECFRKKGTLEGCHQICADNRWKKEGDNFENLSLAGREPYVPPGQGGSSFRVIGGCKAHFFIINGEIVFLGDSGI
jgi:hypothetical protein